MGDDRQRYSILGATSDQVRRAGGMEIREIARLGIIFATLTQAQVQQLQMQGCLVSPVQQTRALVLMPPTPVPAEAKYKPSTLAWAAGIEEARRLSRPPLYGERYTLAILDTGVRKTHQLLTGHVAHERNFSPSPTVADVFNHGTAVASIALAVAPGCNILSLKVLDDEGLGTEESAVAAVAYCMDLWAQGALYAPVVINMSFGAPDVGDPNNALRVACRAAIDMGIWVGAAAGNDGPSPGTIASPACEQYVGAIGSCSYEPFAVSRFSSRGPTREGLVKPDLLFFGEDIEAASCKSDTATIAKGGTSFSMPFIAALSLLFFEGFARGAVPTQAIAGVYPERGVWVPVQVMIDQYLPGLCVKPAASPTTKDNDYGWGMPFGPLAVQAVRLAAVAPALEVVGQVAIPILGIAMMSRLAQSISRGA